MINIYLASYYEEHPTMRQWRERIEAGGWAKVVSRWIEGHHDLPNHSSVSENRELAQKYALEDLQDIGQCHVLIYDARAEIRGKGRGGRQTEFGYAIGRCAILVIGEPENIFQSMADYVYENEHQVFELFAKEGGLPPTWRTRCDLIVGDERQVWK